MKYEAELNELMAIEDRLACITALWTALSLLAAMAGYLG